MSGRFLLVVVALLLAPGAASAQSSQEIGQMRLYIQQLEQRVRELTGEVERLQYELRQTRQQAGIAGPPDDSGGQPMDQGFGMPGQLGSGDMAAPGDNSSAMAGAPPQDLGTFSIAPDDPRIAPDGAGDPASAGPGFDAGAPIDLSELAGGGSGGGFNGAPTMQAPGLSESGAMGGSVSAGQPPTGSTAPVGGGMDAGERAASMDGSAQSGAALASLSGDPRQDYDFAYGYILTGDYADAERSFSAWLERFPNEAQANDARFWLGESLLQQEKHRAAANTFLELYKTAPDSRKAPDALMKLGMSLAALGEKDAACATFEEVTRKYPDASGALANRVASEAQRAGC
ncbi:tol-pal system protein YbgF [Afifella pfennigii]|uniref:tol-pal system protein YbgF n=1 Tax=Afifella pfennigii TaxID=209897 RepID=UPI0006921123|nr:tol-pal system protein YbgF [Afifella pfennigii]